MKPHKDIFNRLRDRNKNKMEQQPSVDVDVVSFIAEANQEDIEKAFINNPEHFLKARGDDDNTIIHMAIKSGKESLIALFLEHDPELISTKNMLSISPIMLAIEEEASLDTIKLLLSSGAKLDDSYILGRTILHIAAEKNRHDLIKPIIDAGIDINKLDNSEETPLLRALKKEHDDTANALLKYGADPLLSDTRNISPIHLALKSNCSKTINTLLNDKVVIQDLNNFKVITPLMLAVEYAQFDMVKKIIDLGADINAQSKTSRNVFTYAMKNKNCETRDNILLLLLDKGIDLNQEDRNPLSDIIALEANIAVISALIDCGINLDKENIAEQSPIYHAVNNKNIPVLKMLLDGGADSNSSNYNNKRPIEMLYSMEDRKKSLEIFKLLHEYGGNITGFAENGRTPLQDAAYAGNLEIVGYILKQNVDVNTKSKYDKEKSAFLFTLTRNDNPEQRLEIAKLLQSNGADINITDNEENTALHCTIGNNNVEYLKWLCDIGLDIHAKNSDNMTAQDCSINIQKIKSVFYLAKRISPNINHKDKDGYTLLHHIAKKGKNNLLHKILEQSDLDIDFRDAEGRTALMLAAHENYIPVMEYLIKHGAKVNAMDKHGRTPLYHAVIKSLSSSVELLLKNNANISILPKNDPTEMLHHAAEAELLPLTEHFLKAGAKIHKPDKDGNTPLHIAIRFENNDIAKYLLNNGANPTTKNNAGFTPHDIARHKGSYSLMSLVNNYIKDKESNSTKKTPSKFFYNRKWGA